MFYSHQLLSKKGPLGHIWMAATMKSKLTRKRAESLDIQELCTQILHPQVPLALRLSGILMGGIVVVYNRKVTILYDDVQHLLSKVQVAVAEEKRVSVDLPRSKLFAKFEAITIDYNFENMDDVEQLMFRPDTPLHDVDPKVGFDEETILLPKRRKSNAQANLSDDGYRYASAHQAQNADITLQEDPPGYEMLDRLFEDERFAPVDDSFQDLHLPDLEIQEPSGHGPGVIESLDEVEVPTGTSEGRGSGNCNLTTGAAETVDREGSSDTPVPLNGAPVASTELGGNASDVEQNPADREAQLAPELPEALVAPKSPEPQSVPPRSRKRRARSTSRILDFDDDTKIPVDTLRVWLQDPSDLVGREAGVKALPQQSHFETLLKLPSTGLTWKSRTDEPRSSWPSCLLDLWRLSICGRPKTRRQAEPRDHRARSPTPKSQWPEDSDFGKEVPATTAERQASVQENALSGSHDSNMQPPVEGPSSTHAEPAAELEAPAHENPDLDLGKPATATSAERQASGPGTGSSGSHDFKIQSSTGDPESEIQPPPGKLSMQGGPGQAVDLEIPALEVPGDLEMFRDYGSVEKLRQALDTPASREDTGSGLGFTPSVSGSHEEPQGSGWSKRRRSTPVSSGLKLDPDVESPTSERSKDSKRQRQSYIFGKSDSPVVFSDNDAPEFMIPSTGLDSMAMPGSLTQFELLVDTNPSTQVADPQQSMDGVTTQLLQFLKNHFRATNAPRWQSVNELATGLEKYQAAKLFYQITVLTSNRYLITQQEEPYSDILISPGQCM